MSQQKVKRRARGETATWWKPRSVIFAAGAAAVVLFAAVAWLTVTTAGSSGSADVNTANREELAARGRQMMLPSDERPKAAPIRIQTASYGDGSVFDLAQEQGKIVVLFFMAAWCATCIPEAEALAQVHENYADKGVRVLVLDVDQRETERELKVFRDRAGSGKHLWAMDTGTQVARTYGVRSLDTTFVIDREGRVAFADGYPTPYDRLAAVIEALL